MAKPPVIHYVQLNSAIKALIASHDTLTATVPVMVEQHKNTLTAKREAMRIERRIRQGSEAHNASLQAASGS